MTIDRERLVALLTALDASSRCLERPVCRGWVCIRRRPTAFMLIKNVLLV